MALAAGNETSELSGVLEKLDGLVQTDPEMGPQVCILHHAAFAEKFTALIENRHQKVSLQLSHPAPLEWTIGCVLQVLSVESYAAGFYKVLGVSGKTVTLQAPKRLRLENYEAEVRGDVLL